MLLKVTSPRFLKIFFKRHIKRKQVPIFVYVSKLVENAHNGVEKKKKKTAILTT